MSIRLVGEGNEVFWFTHNNWVTLLRLARGYGWDGTGKLDPDRWDDDSLRWNDEWEVIGVETVSPDAGRALADAVERGLADPQKWVLREIVNERNATLQRAFPDRQFKLVDFDVEWSNFVVFARRGGFRIDLTD